ncbi:hypothetical protein FRX31_032585 [Thalictrum thalictroides]|uniref:RNase H type-1 domain-containing protein n=1 Tax=Thalictrum thalictroides TaxID=46969 RepID=A0A7J6V0E8_THATH|nr:hypothetical protein FRX31_032585 [Thalictrum thalictroides]
MQFAKMAVRISGCLIIIDTRSLLSTYPESTSFTGSFEEGECSGLLVGAQWAKQQQLGKLILETDNKGAADALQGFHLIYLGCLIFTNYSGNSILF